MIDKCELSVIQHHQGMVGALLQGYLVQETVFAESSRHSKYTIGLLSGAHGLWHSHAVGNSLIP